MPQRECHRQHHVSRRREELAGRHRRSLIHARLESAHTVSESHVGSRDVQRPLVPTVPRLHGFDRACDFLSVRADVLHHRGADCAGDAGQTFHALQPELDGERDEIIPIAAGFGVDVHDSLAVLDRRGLVGHGDLPAGVAHDDAIERPISDQQIGSAANHA